MSITESIELLKAYNGPLGLTLHKGASEKLINKVESTYGITLPADFKTFYRFTDGFETVEDIFNMIPLTEIIENRTRQVNEPLYIAEYMIYSDMWQLEISPKDCNDYKIIVDANYNKLVLTTSLAEFISRFLNGGVFEVNGLYDWRDEVEQQPIYPTKLKATEPLLTVFYHSLRYGLISQKEVIDWADGIVMHDNEPETFFIELSLSRDINELISLLNSVRVPEDAHVARAILGLLYHRLSAGAINADKAISIMDKYKCWNMLTSFEKAHIYNFTDEIWLADPIIHEIELTQEILNFLINYKELEIENYKNWVGISYRIEYLITEEEKKQIADNAARKRKVGLKLLVINGFVYGLALVSFIVLITSYIAGKHSVSSGKFWSDLYQLSLLYIFFFVSYYALVSGYWLLKKAIDGFKKVLR